MIYHNQKKIKYLKQYLDKAEVLIEALPYIQRFNRKIIVVKYGGSAIGLLLWLYR